MTDKYAVIGNPIAHSKSPQIHRLFAQQTDQDISYEAVEAPLDGFAATIERLRKEGYKGCNVTVPFKFEAFQLATQLTQLATKVGAVNTLKFDSNGILGSNTDGIGLIRDLEQNLGITLQGKRVLLVGAGGAASGVALPLSGAGAKLTIANRTASKAQALAATLTSSTSMVIGCSFSALAGQRFDVIINATSSGLTDEMPDIPNTIFAPGALAYDMMYGRETPFMKFTRQHGATIVTDGLGMLVEQAAESFYIWRSVRPVTAPIITALRNK